jgi:hypothetical protein
MLTLNLQLGSLIYILNYYCIQIYVDFRYRTGDLFHDFPHVHPGCVMLENQCYKHKQNSAMNHKLCRKE